MHANGLIIKANKKQEKAPSYMKELFFKYPVYIQVCSSSDQENIFRIP